jgi:hypothetical protein
MIDKTVKIYIDLRNFNDTWLCRISELAMVVPFIDKERRDKFINQDDPLERRTPLLQELINQAHKYFTPATIEEADIALLPFKYGDSNPTEYFNLARKFDKKIIAFFNDDFTEPIQLPDEVVLFRTSLYRSRRKLNEYAMPTFSGDFYTGLIQASEKPSISFCGGVTSPIRMKCIERLRDSELINNDFIIRNGFWAKGVPKETAIKEFHNSINSSLYGFCCRGAGNFSFRLGEILSHGRIPVVIDTDCVFPYSDSINWNDYAVVVPEWDIDNIVNRILDHYDSLTNEEILDWQSKNREIWKSHFTPLGFCKQLSQFITERIL